MNLLIITGNITRTPETRTVGENTVCNFDVAVNRDYKKDGQPDVDFFRVAAWGKLGNLCQQYLDKGRKVAVTGEVSCRAYANKEGEPKASLEVHASKVEFLSPKQDAGTQTEQSSTNEMSDVPADEIPF